MMVRGHSLDNSRNPNNIPGMSETTHYMTAAVAKMLGCTGDTVRRLSRVNKIGKSIGTARIYTAADVAKLRKIVQPRAGNPGKNRV